MAAPAWPRPPPPARAGRGPRRRPHERCCRNSVRLGIGFQVLEKPSELPTESASLFILLLFNMGWELGKFSAHKPRARKFKYEITFADGVRPKELKLEKYYEGDEEPTEAHSEEDAGLWVLLKKSNAAGPAAMEED